MRKGAWSASKVSRPPLSQTALEIVAMSTAPLWSVREQLALGLRVARLGLDGHLAVGVHLFGEALDGDPVRVRRGRHIGEVEGGPPSPGGGGVGRRVVIAPAGHQTQRERHAGGDRHQTPAPRALLHVRPLSRRTSTPEPPTPTPPDMPVTRPRDARIGATLPRPDRRLSTSARTPSWYVQPGLPWGISGGFSPPSPPTDGVDDPPQVTYAACTVRGDATPLGSIAFKPSGRLASALAIRVQLPFTD